MSEREIRQLTSLLLGSLEVVEAAELDMDVEESLGDLRHVLKDLQDVSMRIAINEEPIATDRAISGGAWAWAWGFAIGQPEPLLGASPDEVIGWWLWTTHAFAP